MEGVAISNHAATRYLLRAAWKPKPHTPEDMDAARQCLALAMHTAERTGMVTTDGAVVWRTADGFYPLVAGDKLMVTVYDPALIRRSIREGKILEAAS